MGMRRAGMDAVILALLTAPALASADGPRGLVEGKAIAGTDMDEVFFEDVAGWTVLRADDSDQTYCVAETGLGQDILRLGYDGTVWQVAVPRGTGSDWVGFLDVDGWNRNAAGASVGDWAVTPIDAPILGQVAGGQFLTLDLGTGPWRYSLAGATEAIETVERCASTALQSAING